MKRYEFGERVAVRYPPSASSRPPRLPPDDTIGSVIVAGYDPIVSFAQPPCTVPCDNEWLALARDEAPAG